MEILTRPLRITALKKLLKNDAPLSVNIVLSLGDFLNKNMDDFNDLVEERVIDKDKVLAHLSDIYYTVVGHIPPGEVYINGGIILHVNAEVDI